MYNTPVLQRPSLDGGGIWEQTHGKVVYFSQRYVREYSSSASCDKAMDNNTHLLATASLDLGHKRL